MPETLICIEFGRLSEEGLYVDCSLGAGLKVSYAQALGLLCSLLLSYHSRKVYFVADKDYMRLRVLAFFEKLKPFRKIIKGCSTCIYQNILPTSYTRMTMRASLR